MANSHKYFPGHDFVNYSFIHWMNIYWESIAFPELWQMMKELRINMTGLLPSESLVSTKRDIISLQRTKNKIEREIHLLSGVLISMREALRTENTSSYHYWRRGGKAADICTKTWDTSAEEIDSEKSDWKSSLRNSESLGFSELII